MAIFDQWRLMFCVTQVVYPISKFFHLLVKAFFSWQENFTALHTACQYGHASVVQLLLSSECDVSAVDDVSNWTELSSTMQRQCIYPSLFSNILCLLVMPVAYIDNGFMVIF